MLFRKHSRSVVPSALQRVLRQGRLCQVTLPGRDPRVGRLRREARLRPRTRAGASVSAQASGNVEPCADHCEPPAAHAVTRRRRQRAAGREPFRLRDSLRDGAVDALRAPRRHDARGSPLLARGRRGPRHRVPLRPEHLDAPPGPAQEDRRCAPSTDDCDGVGCAERRDDRHGGLACDVGVTCLPPLSRRLAHPFPKPAPLLTCVLLSTSSALLVTTRRIPSSSFARCSPPFELCFPLPLRVSSRPAPAQPLRA